MDLSAGCDMINHSILQDCFGINGTVLMLIIPTLQTEHKNSYLTNCIQKIELGDLLASQHVLFLIASRLFSILIP